MVSNVGIAFASVWFATISIIAICTYAWYALDQDHYTWVVIILGLGLLSVCIGTTLVLHLKNFLNEPQTLIAVLVSASIILVTMHLSLTLRRQ